MKHFSKSFLNPIKEGNREEEGGELNSGGQ